MCVSVVSRTGLSSADRVKFFLMTGGRNVPTKCLGVCRFGSDTKLGITRRLFHVGKAWSSNSMAAGSSIKVTVNKVVDNRFIIFLLATYKYIK